MVGISSAVQKLFRRDRKPAPTPARMRRLHHVSFDGTWAGEPLSTRVTIVSQLGKMIADHENVHEIPIPGVGTGPGFTNKLFGGIGGWGTLRNVIIAYGNLAEDYQRGDRIILTGFSRGAWAARYLAFIIDRVGLPQDVDNGLLKKLYKVCDNDLHVQDESAIDELHDGYKWRYNVRVTALCCFDTVGSLGVPLDGMAAPLRLFAKERTMSLIVSKVASNVDHAFHALALHETRAPYSPTLMSGENVYETFFPGVHKDMGFIGKEEGLSHAPFAWMIQQLHLHSKIDFDHEKLRKRFPSYGRVRDLPALHAPQQTDSTSRGDASQAYDNSVRLKNTSLSLMTPSWYGGRIHCYNSGMLFILGERKRKLQSESSDIATTPGGQEYLAAFSKFRIHVGARMRFAEGDHDVVQKYYPGGGGIGSLVWVLRQDDGSRSRRWPRTRRQAQTQPVAMEQQIREEWIGEMEATLLGLDLREHQHATG